MVHNISNPNKKFHDILIQRNSHNIRLKQKHPAFLDKGGVVIFLRPKGYQMQLNNHAPLRGDVEAAGCSRKCRCQIILKTLLTLTLWYTLY